MKSLMMANGSLSEAWTQSIRAIAEVFGPCGYVRGTCNQEEGEFMEQDVGFQVTEPTEVGDLSGVSDDQSMPKAQGIQVRIEKPTVRRTLQNNKVAEDEVNNPCIAKEINAQLRILPEGIDGAGAYANKVLFPNPRWYIWAEVTHEFYAKRAIFSGEKRAYLNPFKTLLLALGYDIKSPPPINDEFLTVIEGQTLVIDISRESERALVNGVWEDTGGYLNKVRKIRAAG